MYVSDYSFPDMQYARMIRSTIPRGRIVSIKVPELPDGYWFITHKDIPEEGRNELWMIQKDWKCFAEDDVKYVGETIGLLVGPDRNMLDYLIHRIEIEYEEQEPAITIDDALALKGGPIIGEDNILCQLFVEKGRPMDEVFKEADSIFEETIETGFQEHVHLETNGAIATIEDGKFTIYASAQCPFYIRKAVAGLLNLQPEDIVVKQTTTGGAFGGKEHFPDVLCGPLLVAENKVRKPIKLIFDRGEDMLYSVKRHPSKTTFRTALDKDGNILGIDGLVIYNCGPYLSGSFVVLQRGVFHANGVYDIPNTYVKGIGIATNTFPSDAFRGFGAPQTLYAIETHLEHIAKRFGFDPAEYKSRCFIKQGGETITNGHIVEKVVLPEMMKQVVDASDYYRKAKEYTPGCGKGIGISFYNHGGAFTGNGEQSIIKAHARLVRTGDRVRIEVGSTEMGQGFQTTLRKIAAATLGISIDDVDYDNPDTSIVPDSGPTAASRSTMIVGRLIERCAQEMKERWNEGDFSVEKEYQHPDGHLS